VEAKHLHHYKQLLVAKQRELSAAALGTLSPSDSTGGWRGDLADEVTQAAAAGLEVRLRETDSRLLRAVEEALARMEQGTFGLCENCHRSISPARLDAVPWTRLCRDCKELQQT
jgi:DnaK suppressor protein